MHSYEQRQSLGIPADVSAEVGRAISQTAESEPNYFNEALSQRAGLSEDGSPNSFAAGSVYEGVTPRELRETLTTAEWQPYSHPDILPGCKAFRAEISGRLGIANLKDLPPDALVQIDDRKGTGQASIVVEGIRGEIVPYTVLITGKDEKSPNMMMWTFHPGAPIRPTTMEVQGRHGESITVREALALGFELAKIVAPKQ